MKKYMYVAGAFALLVGVLPAAALAESNGTEGGADTQVTAVTQVRVSDDADTSVTGSARVNDDDDEATISNRKDDDQATSSDDQDVDDESVSDDKDDFDFDDEFKFELEDDEDLAFSLDDLKQKIEERKHELEDEEASTTPKFKNAMKNANEVRLAVHALLASKDLLGGIGQQVSEIAKQMNDSVATTTSAEAQIESRSFLAKLFFGGDQKAAKVINKEAERNQKSIEKLRELLDGAALSVDFQTALKAQITALEEAQARFQVLAEKEQSRWGIFSWRF